MKKKNIPPCGIEAARTAGNPAYRPFKFTRGSSKKLSELDVVAGGGGDSERSPSPPSNSSPSFLSSSFVAALPACLRFYCVVCEQIYLLFVRVGVGCERPAWCGIQV